MGEVKLTRPRAGVALITLSAPEVRNALSAAMATQLVDVCSEIDADETIGAAVLRGEDGFFCSGGDRREWVVYEDPDCRAARARAATMYSSFLRVGSLKVPSVAAVRGAAIGAGLNLALAADLRVVSREARLIGFGSALVHPGGGFLALLGRLGGREVAAAMGVFGEVVTGIRAVESGLAWEAVDDDEVEPRALSHAEFAGRNPSLSRSVVHSLRAQLGPPGVAWPVAIELDREAQRASWRDHPGDLIPTDFASGTDKG